jgi:putative transposase
MREDIIRFMELVCSKSSYNKRELLAMLVLSKSRYYDWLQRQGKPNAHNGIVPKAHWLLPEERDAILKYCKDKIGEGYRRLTYQMLDANIAAVSPSTTYRVLKEAGLLRRWSKKASGKGSGFHQPDAVHDHWHVDISYINILGTIFFLITVMDGASRYILHHELRTHMTEYDVEITIERAKDKFPDA